MSYALLLAKFTPEGSKAVTDEGFVARRSATEAFCAAMGGKNIAYFATADGEWDIVNISEMPDDDAGRSRALAKLTQSGAYAKIRMIPLVAPEDFDAVDVEALAALRPPGQ